MADPLRFDPVPGLAGELSLPGERVRAVIQLLADGNTVPFIARYRKEATGGLDDATIHGISERCGYLQELHDRRVAILKSIEQQGALSEDLRQRLQSCATKSELEDLYLPYRPKRRTRAAIARERGLAPLAQRILAQDDVAPAEAAAPFVDPARGVPDVEAALAGARDVVAEIVAEDAALRQFVRGVWSEHGEVTSRSVPERTQEATRFEQYYDFRERVRSVPSHRYLALCRGEEEGVLRVRLEVDGERVLPGLERRLRVAPRSPLAGVLREAIADSYKRLLGPSIESELRVELKTRSDRAAVEVFAENLRALLLSAPLGQRCVLGVDPGLRTGCKCAAVDATGKFLGHANFNLVQDLERAEQRFLALVARYKPQAIAIGNGTAGRMTLTFVQKALKSAGVADLIVVSVNEAGASVYSASEIARQEFPDLDVTVRGAISIARRLQDPLAELVKIEPRSIGVGQYQHDVHQPLLQKKLGEVVESCVNQVGVELNTTSAPLLSQVAGIGPRLAHTIVAHREAHGPFASRRQLLKVAGLGPRTFEQCAGFLRLREGSHPLDASAVHPERYALVERMAKDLGVGVAELVGDATLAARIDLGRYVGDGVGEPTLRDILEELCKPGRDPRQQFEPPRFREDVQEIEDLRPGMVLEGVVTNVTAFGAFVDVGVHQDGLVHVSELADRFVKDPAEVVRVGDRLTVRVKSVDLERRRIALSARQQADPPSAERRPSGRRDARPSKQGQGKSKRPNHGARSGAPAPPPRGQNNPLGDALKDFFKSP